MKRDVWVYDLPNEDYHNQEGISSSHLPALLQGPAFYKAQKITTTPAMQLGTLVHTLVLEPELFDPAEVVLQDGRLKPGSDAYVRKQRDIITQAQVIAQAVLDCPQAVELLDGTAKEVSLLRQWEGVLCRVRWDGYHMAEGYGVDLKTTSATTYEELLYQAIIPYAYDIKQAFYRAVTGDFAYGGFDYPDYWWIFVSKKEPYPVWVVKPSDAMLDVGVEKSREACAIYKRCQERNEWPKPSAGPYIAEYPKYFRR